MASLFTKIIQGEIPSYKIAENNYCFAFLDINPLTSGHTLVVPKKEIDYIFDLDDPSYVELFTFAKKVSFALKKAIICKRIGLSVIGIEIAHAHIHLIPINHIGDINFSAERPTFSENEFKEVAAKIKSMF